MISPVDKATSYIKKYGVEAVVQVEQIIAMCPMSSSWYDWVRVINFQWMVSSRIFKIIPSRFEKVSGRSDGTGYRNTLIWTMPQTCCIAVGISAVRMKKDFLRQLLWLHRVLWVEDWVWGPRLLRERQQCYHNALNLWLHVCCEVVALSGGNPCS